MDLLCVNKMIILFFGPLAVLCDRTSDLSLLKEVTDEVMRYLLKSERI